MPTTMVHTKTGQSGEVPSENVERALQSGFERAVRLRNPNTNDVVIAPFSLADKYLSAGFKIDHSQE